MAMYTLFLFLSTVQPEHPAAAPHRHQLKPAHPAWPAFRTIPSQARLLPLGQGPVGSQISGGLCFGAVRSHHRRLTQHTRHPAASAFY